MTLQRIRGSRKICGTARRATSRDRCMRSWSTCSHAPALARRCPTATLAQPLLCSHPPRHRRLRLTTGTAAARSRSGSCSTVQTSTARTWSGRANWCRFLATTTARCSARPCATQLKSAWHGRFISSAATSSGGVVSSQVFQAVSTRPVCGADSRRRAKFHSPKNSRPGSLL